MSWIMLKVCSLPTDGPLDCAPPGDGFLLYVSLEILSTSRAQLVSRENRKMNCQHNSNTTTEHTVQAIKIKCKIKT